MERIIRIIGNSIVLLCIVCGCASLNTKHTKRSEERKDLTIVHGSSSYHDLSTKFVQVLDKDIQISTTRTTFDSLGRKVEETVQLQKMTDNSTISTTEESAKKSSRNTTAKDKGSFSTTTKTEVDAKVGFTGFSTIVNIAIILLVLGAIVAIVRRKE